MRLFFTVLLFSSQAFAAHRYVKNAGGTGAGTSNASAWSPAYYASTGKGLLAAGDTVFLNRGETFPPLTLATNNGNSGGRITYAAYGTGAKPIISGMSTVSGWTLLSGNIYYAPVDVPRLQLVTVDGAVRGVGRYPNSGYLTIGSHTGLTSLTAPTVSAIPGNPAGGEVVVKMLRYIISRFPITSRSSNTLNITANNEFGFNQGYNIDDGNGYFVQNYVGALDQDGEWSYDAAAKRLYMYFASGNTSSHVVQASLYDDVVKVQARSYFAFDNIDIQGANIAAVNYKYASYVSFTNCSMSKCTVGADGLEGSGNILFDRDTISGALSQSIFAYSTPNVTVTNCLIQNTHPIAGMGQSGDMVGSGVAIRGNYPYIANNKVLNSGYCGISVYGGHGAIMENNIVDGYSLNKDDAGGLYMYGDSAQTYVGRIIRNNLVKNGIGNIEGVGGAFGSLAFACGIYMDNFSSNVNIYNNFVYDNTGAGAFFNSTNTDTLAYNSFFNNGFEAFLLLSYGTTRGSGKNDQTVHDLYVHHNEMIAKTAGQILLNFEMYDNPSRLNTIGTFNNNIFYRPFGVAPDYIRKDDRSTGSRIVTDYTISSWLSTYSKEQSSINSTVPISDASKFRVDYNSTATTSPVTLDAIYRNVSNSSFPGIINLSPYSGRVLIYDSALPTGGLNSIQIRFPYKVITQ